MGEATTGTATPLRAYPDEGERGVVFPYRLVTERSEDEIAACARPLEWDESGFPLPRRQPRSLSARVWRWLER